MKVLGTVKDAAMEVPLPGAKISLYVREEELAVLQSDSEGKFEHESESQYLGEILICKVEKAGYEPQEVIQEFEEDVVTLAIKLVPKKEEKIELTVNLKDEKRNPLKGVNISLEVSGEEVGVGISDKDGIFKISLSPDLEGKTINYKAELAGFELASGAVLLKKETSHEITMKKHPAPPSNRKWLKIAAVVAGIAIVILAVMIILPTPESEMPEIKYFVASPSTISTEKGSTLSWSVSDATSVTIDPEIGTVALTGSRVISPVKTTTYTITATNDAGNRFDKVKVIVNGLVIDEVIVKEGEVNLPVISSFEASPSAISTGEGSTLSWSVSDATRVTIEPGIGSVALTGTRAVYPTETTIYSLTATTEAESVDATVEVTVEEKEINLPVINYFEASPNEIKRDGSSTLTWDVSDDASVTIDHEIGNVRLTGTRLVSPSETTTYTLTATNDAGSVDETVEVIVDTTPLLPDLCVDHFSLDPPSPIQDSPVDVHVGVYNKGNARSGPFTVQWWAGETFIAPACTWQVDYLAAGSGKSLTCSYEGYAFHGSITTKVVVDSAGGVVESKEENNEDSMTISVSRSRVIVIPTPTKLVLKPIQKTHSTGPLTISQTWTADLDEGEVGAGADSDIWFQAATATERYITPRNGATIAKVGATSVGLEGCREAPLSSSRININNLPEGTYVCVRTNLGRYSQFRVNEPVGPSPGTLNIGYTTWEAI